MPPTTTAPRATEGSFHSYMWQALESKARFFGQVITGDNAARRAEYIGGQTRLSGPTPERRINQLNEAKLSLPKPFPKPERPLFWVRETHCPAPTILKRRFFRFSHAIRIVAR